MKDRVWAHLRRILDDGPLHMTLVDPASSPGKAGQAIALEAARLGTHALMVGGSTDVSSENLDELVRAVKSHTDLPVIHFPSSAGAISSRVDAIYFLSTLNSLNPRVLVGEQARAAPALSRLGVEPIGMGYIIVDPGMKVGVVSEARLLPRSPVGTDVAIGYALAAQFFGMKLVYLEAGSGAPEPVPADMVRGVRQAIQIPLVVGGGIRTPAQASLLLDAGADVLVTGTVAENGHFHRLAEIVGEVKRRRRG